MKLSTFAIISALAAVSDAFDYTWDLYPSNSDAENCLNPSCAAVSGSSLSDLDAKVKACSAAAPKSCRYEILFSMVNAADSGPITVPCLGGSSGEFLAVDLSPLKAVNAPTISDLVNITRGWVGVEINMETASSVFTREEVLTTTTGSSTTKGSSATGSTTTGSTTSGSTTTKGSSATGSTTTGSTATKASSIPEQSTSSIAEESTSSIAEQTPTSTFVKATFAEQTPTSTSEPTFTTTSEPTFTSVGGGARSISHAHCPFETYNVDVSASQSCSNLDLSGMQAKEFIMEDGDSKFGVLVDLLPLQSQASPLLVANVADWAGCGTRVSDASVDFVDFYGYFYGSSGVRMNIAAGAVVAVVTGWLLW